MDEFIDDVIGFRLPDVCRYRDYAGMSALHHACRARDNHWIQKFLEANESMVNETTYSTSSPKGWTALQCLVNNALPDDERGILDLKAAIDMSFATNVIHHGLQ